MLVRLLGKDEEAKTGIWDIPFTDVDEWAKPYVGYAYANKLTTGTSDTTFGGAQTVSPSQYLTFVLRAMGYESGTDFQWDKAWELTDTLGITHGEYGPDTPLHPGKCGPHLSLRPVRQPQGRRQEPFGISGAWEA